MSLSSSKYLEFFPVSKLLTVSAFLQIGSYFCRSGHISIAGKKKKNVLGK